MTTWRSGEGGLLDNLWAADVSRLMEANAEAVFRTDVINALRDEGYLIIERDENGEWPDDVVGQMTWGQDARGGMMARHKHYHNIYDGPSPEYPESLVRAALDALASSQGEKEPICDHNWVSARNEIIVSGEICLKCNAIRAEEPTREREPPTT